MRPPATGPSPARRRADPGGERGWTITEVAALVVIGVATLLAAAHLLGWIG